MKPYVVILAAVSLAACGAPEPTAENIQKQVDTIEAGRDLDGSLKNLESMAADKNSPEAALVAGRMLSDGKHYPTDSQRACVYFELASTKLAEGMHQLARCHERGGFDGKKDPTKAAATYEKAIAMGLKSGACDYGSMLIRNKIDIPKGEKICVDAAAGGDHAAAVRIGTMYMNGEGVAASPTKAQAVFQPAADAGDGSAALWLGSMYGIGNGIKKDEALAAKYWTVAYEKGKAEGAQYLGDLALNRARKGDKAAIAEAEAWYAKSLAIDSKSSAKSLIDNNIKELATLKAKG